MSMVSGVIGGVDTHADVHVAAAIDTNGGVLGIESFPTDTAGYEAMTRWLVGFGPVLRIGVEGTGVPPVSRTPRQWAMVRLERSPIGKGTRTAAAAAIAS
jgi:hypothetical protein